jgi:alkylation response protein AidB-like acyl-CoA dehydrogenase
MDVRLTDEQALWDETVGRLASDLAMTVPDDDAAEAALHERWQRVLELGVPALRSPALSGLDHTGVETALCAEQFGRHLVALPLLGQGIIVPELLAAAEADDLLARVTAGELRIAPAFDPGLGQFASHGTSAVAWDAAGATHALMVEERAAGRQLVAVELSCPPVEGLDITRRYGRIPPAAVAHDLGPLGLPIGPDRWARVEAVALTALAADLLGIMDGALADAVRHVSERRQFDVPVGSFQAVQHLAADCLVQVEGARSCVWYAAWAIDGAEAAERRIAAHTAKAYASRAAREVVEATIQMFGGVAITWEYLSHARARRMWTDRRVLGDERTHYAAIAAARLAAAKAA